MANTSEAYLITADVSDGIVGRDYSSASVWDVSSWEQVAHYHGYVEPMKFGYILRDLGCYYNWATIAVETNYPGNATYAKLIELQYPKLWHDPDTNEAWRTTEKLRSLAISCLREALRESTIKINSLKTISELKTFVARKNHKLEAEQGSHDDCVMDAMMAAYILKNTAFITNVLQEIRRQPLREILHRTSGKRKSYSGKPGSIV